MIRFRVQDFRFGSQGSLRNIVAYYVSESDDRESLVM